MTNQNTTIIGPPRRTAIGLPAGVVLHPVRWASDRYNLYRYTDLLEAFQDVLRTGCYPDHFEERLNRVMAGPGRGRWAAICQWDEAYVGTHIGRVSENITFDEEMVARLVARLDCDRGRLTFTQREQFFHAE